MPFSSGTRYEDNEDKFEDNRRALCLRTPAGGRASFVMSSALRDLAHAIARARRASVCASPRASRGYAKAARRCTNRRERCCQALAHLCANCHSMGLSAAGARHPPARTAYSRSVVKQITWPGGQMPCFTTFHAAGSKQVVARLPSALRGSCSALWQSFGCRKLLQAAGMADGRSLAAGQRAGRPTAAAGKGAVPSLEDPTARPPFFGVAPRALYLEDNTSVYRSQMRSTSFDSWRRGIPACGDSP